MTTHAINNNSKMEVMEALVGFLPSGNSELESGNNLIPHFLIVLGTSNASEHAQTWKGDGQNEYRRCCG